MHIYLLGAALLGVVQLASAAGPFFTTVNANQYVLGNDIWNITVGTRYGTRLNYKGRDLVGKAAGHYVSHSTSLPFPLNSTPMHSISEHMTHVYP